MVEVSTVIVVCSLWGITGAILFGIWYNNDHTPQATLVGVMLTFILLLVMVWVTAYFRYNG